MSRRRREGEQPTSLSGWMYADVLLALVVVGLATSWIASDSPPPVVPESTTTSTSTTTTTTTTTIPEGPQQFQLSCDEVLLSPDVLQDDGTLGADVTKVLNDEIKARGLEPEEAKPGLVLVFGGYDGTGDDGIRAGANRAEKFAPVLRSQVPSFKTVKIRPSGGSRLVTVNGEEFRVGGSGRFAAIVYLVFLGEPRPEDIGCTG